ncbi:NAD(P)-dependent oxidoreductase [Amycolatopsis orientalis]|uniref:NAD(P)-dependent oxidoreductase n=1 Tax=Amycolatopsis orientalis TaxID=31958 RepID=UPI00039FB3E1|nr:NAD(P)H-binding protein [Amycolatopsis orientalis]
MMPEQRTGPIVVFGAGGRAGLAVAAEALRRRRPVIGVVRDPARHEKLASLGEEVTVVAGDLTNPDSLMSLPGEVAALVNAVTPFTAPPESFDDFDPDYYVRLAENLVRAARGSRVLEIGLAATLRTGSGRVFEDPAAFPAFLRPFAEARMKGLAAWHAQPAEVDWLVLTPPPGLSLEAPATGEYRLGADVLDARSANTPLSYADLATAVLDQIEKPTVSRRQASVYR